MRFYSLPLQKILSEWCKVWKIQSKKFHPHDFCPTPTTSVSGSHRPRGFHVERGLLACLSAAEFQAAGILVGCLPGADAAVLSSKMYPGLRQ